jgi:hypothetical protein
MYNKAMFLGAYRRKPLGVRKDVFLLILSNKNEENI